MKKQRHTRSVRFRRSDAIAIVLVSLILIGITWAVICSPSYMLAGTIVTRATTTEKVVALTFDDGPLPIHTEETLAILSAYDVPATFFVIGHEAVRHYDELVAIVEAGHAVGNHGYTHQMMAFMTPAQVRDEIEATDSIIRAAGYDGSIPFRAPYNLKFIALPLYLQYTNRPDVSRDIKVDEGTARTAQEIADDVLARVQPGSIVLLHPMYDHTATSREALPLIIDGLDAEGYRFLTIPELLML